MIFRTLPPTAQHAVAALALATAASGALAQAQPAPLRNSATPAQAASAPAPALSALPPANPKFVLREVRFTPTLAVPTRDLQAAVKPFIGREIDAVELTVLSATLRRVYEDRGYGLAGVGFPPQDLSQGVLQVTVVEPRLERITLETSPTAPISLARTEAVLANSGVRKGGALDLQSLDRAMFTLNDWPGVAAKATLVPTGDEGAYNVNIQTEPRRGWDASVDADNHGSAASGRYRLGALLRWNNPSGRGDNLDLRVMASNGRGTTVGRLGYETPIGATPWRVGLGFARVGYELGEQFESLNAVGSANVFDASLSYPFVRSREGNLVGRLALVNKGLVDEFSGDGFTDTTDKTVRAADFSVSFESRSTWGGGGFNGGNVGLQFGRLIIDTEARRAADAALGDGATQGNFTKLSAQLTRLQAVTRTVSLFAGVAGQWASKNLDNAEKLTLGGDKGVRAYPSSEGASDVGALFNAELRYWIGPQWTSYVFYDVGYGRLQRRPINPAEDNTRTLHGAGLGIQYTNPDLFTLKASLAVRGSEPVRTEEDARTRLLVQVSHSF
jgi:hemolysin activation/secretion protein